MSTFDIVFTICLILAVISFTEVMVTASWGNNNYCDHPFIATPKNIYDRTKLNWVFCCVFFIALRVMSPIVSLVLFIHWILHVGRKEKKNG